MGLTSDGRLDYDSQMALLDLAVDAELASQRQALISGINPGFRGSLTMASTPMAQLMLDIQNLNRLRKLTDGSHPLLIWLYSAAMLAADPALGAKIRQYAVALESWQEVQVDSRFTPNRKGLNELLLSMFSGNDLEIFTRSNFSEIQYYLNFNRPMAHLVSEYVTVLERRGLKKYLWDALLQYNPGRAADIEAVRH